jgi:hypothetical protein
MPSLQANLEEEDKISVKDVTKLDSLKILQICNLLAISFPSII